MKTKIFLYKGDNISVLKKQSIKPNIIYMDPPYNTTGNLTYSDSVDTRIWKKTFHNLVQEIDKQSQPNSVYFVSIGSKELPSVILTLSEILGKSSNISILPRRTHSGHKTSKMIIQHHDFLVVAKKGNVNFKGEKLDVNNYKLKDKYFKQRGFYQLRRVDYKDFRWSPTLDSEIEINGKYFYPGGVKKQAFLDRRKNHNEKDWAWIWSEKKIRFALDNGYLEIKNNRLYKKTYTKSSIVKIEKGKYKITNRQRKKMISSLHFVDKVFASKTSKTEPESLFDYPKSDKLIMTILELPDFKTKVVLDPFGGTGTTAFCANELGIDQVHIIQISEKTKEASLAFKKGFKDIYDITKKNIQERTEKEIEEVKWQKNQI